MAMGSGGAIGSTYNIMPKMFVNMRNAFESGDTAKAMVIQEQANEVIQICMDVYDFKVSGFNIISSLMVGVQSGNPLPTKNLLEETAGLLRRPLFQGGGAKH